MIKCPLSITNLIPEFTSDEQKNNYLKANAK